MKRDDKTAISLILRYAIIILSSLGSLYLFYLIFTPLTLFPVYFILKIFSFPELSGNLITLTSQNFELVNACIAGTAYFILFMLNLSTPNIRLRNRVLGIIFSFLIFLILNIIRILFLIFISLKIPSLFIPVHEIFWYVLSTVFVVAIWIAETKYFKIKSVPFYSDIIFLYKKSSFKH